MKKLIAALLCLAMVLTSVTAVAEEVAQAVLAQAFASKINEFFAGVGPGTAVEWNVAPTGSGPLNAKMSILVDEAGRELDDVTLQLPGEEYPVKVQFDQAEQAIYASCQGKVIGLRLSDLEGIAQAVTGAMAAPQIDTEVLQEIGQLFVMDVILPGVKVDQEENAYTVQIDLQVKEVLAGIAKFGDEVLANEKYWNALKPLLQFYAAQQQYSGDFAADFEKNWPLIKMQLQSVKTDARFTANLIVRNVGGTAAVVGKASYTEGAQAVTLTLSAADSRKSFEMESAVTMAYGEMSQTLAELNVSCDKRAGNLNAALSVMQGQLDVKLTGSVSDIYRTTSLQGHLTVAQNGASLLVADVEAFSADGDLNANLQVTASRSTVTANLYWSEFVKTFTLNADGQTLKAEIRNDEEGNFSVSVGLPGNNGTIKADGTLTESTLHVTVTYTNTLMAMARYGNGELFSAELTAAWGSAGLTANVTALVNRQVYAGQLYISSTAQMFSFQSRNSSLSLNVQEDMRGSVTVARLSYIDGSYSGSGSWEITYTPDAVVYEDARTKVTVTQTYTSETERVFDAEKLEKRTRKISHAYIRYRLIEEAEEKRIDIEVEDFNGQITMSEFLAIRPAGEVARLAERNPFYITPDVAMQLLQDPSALEAMFEALPVTDAEPAEEAPVEEAPVEEAPVEAEPVEEAPAETPAEEPAAGSSFYDGLKNAQ